MSRYVFSGFIERIEGPWCYLRMNDRTVPSNPIEEWQVGRAKFRHPIHEGQYVTFTVSSRGTGRFHQVTRTWTAAEIARAHKQAQKWMELFGIESLAPPGPPDEA